MKILGAYASQNQFLNHERHKREEVDLSVYFSLLNVVYYIGDSF